MMAGSRPAAPRFRGKVGPMLAAFSLTPIGTDESLGVESVERRLR